MSLLRFEVRYPNGHRDTVIVEGERALIGSASYADVRLPVDQAAYEHVVIEVMGGSVRAEAKAQHPRATINGMPLTASPVDPNAVLGIGTVQLFVGLVAEDTGRPDQGRKQKKSDSSPILRIVGLVALPVLGYIALMNPEATIPAPPTSAPALFGDAAISCPQTAREQALALAREKMDIAEGKRERHPFAPAEGVAAVALYQEAAACFRAANAEALAVEAEATAKQLRGTINADFRARRLRLEHMLAVKDFELALNDVDVLMSLTQGRSGPYTAWLSSLSGDLRRRVR